MAHAAHVLTPLWRIQGVALVLSPLIGLLCLWTGDALDQRSLNVLDAASAFQQKQPIPELDALLLNWAQVVAWCAETFHLKLYSTARLLSVAVDTLLVMGFILTCRVFGADHKVCWMALFVGLSLPMINESRHLLTPIPLLWLLFIGVLWLHGRLCRGVLWPDVLGVSLLLLVLSRLHPPLVWLLLLWPLLPCGHQVRGLRYAPWLVFAIAVLFSEVGFGDTVLNLLHEELQQPWLAMQERVALMRQWVLGEAMSQYAWPALLAVMLLVVLDQIVVTLTPLYCVLPLFASLRRHFAPVTNLRRFWIVLLLLLSLLQWQVMVPELQPSGLLIELQVLVLLLIVPFTLAALHDAWLLRRGPQYVLPFTVVALMLMFTVGDGFFSLQHRAVILREAGLWLRQADVDLERVYINERRIRYYAAPEALPSGELDQPPVWHLDAAAIAQTDWSQYDYLAVWTSGRTPDLAPLHAALAHEAALFSQRTMAGDQVHIYRLGAAPE